MGGASQIFNGLLSTKAAFEASIEYINGKSLALKSLNKMADDSAMVKYCDFRSFLPVEFHTSFSKSEKFLFKGIQYEEDSSWIAGKMIKRYNGKKFNMEIPYFDNCVAVDSVRAPKAYLIPRQWNIFVDKLQLHGIVVEELKEDTTLDVERYRFKNVKFTTRPFEGRFIPAYDVVSFKEKANIPKGTYVIFTKQRSIRCIVNLLEPKAPDSFIKWGFLNSIFEQKEYFEEYSMEPIAQRMADINPQLKEEFLKKLSEDETLRMSPNRRLDFFYEHSEYFDKEMNLYPIMRTDSL